MTTELATLVIDLRELARTSALFDDGARRIIATELLAVAGRFAPGLRSRRFVHSGKCDGNGLPLYRRAG